jgi:hypothetical protein
MMQVSDGPDFASHESLAEEVVKVEYLSVEADLDLRQLVDGGQVHQRRRYSIHETALAIVSKVYPGLCSFS